ncbi:O-antigen ligase family protein [Flavobacterium sp. Fl-77]|uniref:O-antigen ligase family protein n=1 Tax=Flavobacterium flavipigmentatum TaxID=2893884 RepID=A0AAJ2SB69_9FLAO|nr:MULTISPECIES: O-antigen ligase family protein [unclassified Flavobacterium]MDX6180981.1 O-antigen ligase family protein [Flavobacterium sp. Fl-33]MDX6184582.1 O-antigen ligase family protein [Flavobacterium sp. Fl-77]UFH39686.1 O-antigen ligase family protein [Flavobacterium sp. F-70]
MIFRKPCSLLIILFAVFNLIFLKKAKYSKTSLILMGCIASPILLELLLFWNNDSFVKGLKAIEKSTSLIVFPLFIIGNYKRVKFFRIVEIYTLATTFVLLFFFIRFVIVFPELINKYLGGTDLWEMGYKFSDSIGIHAPALNMHLAFVSVCTLYFVFYSFSNREKTIFKIGRIAVFILSFFFVLFVNTRMALVNVLAGFIILLFLDLKAKINLKKLLLTSLALLFLLGGILFLFIQKNPYMKEKYSTATFAYMDKVGKLDEIDHPEVKVFNSLVTRLSIWKSAWELSLKNLPFGVGASDGKKELVKYYKQTNQQFLAKYKFQTHNQFLDSFLKFGFFGPMIVLLYIFTIGYLGYDLRNAIILSFFLLFFTSNLTDDFLLRFDGIAFSGFWFSIFSSYWLQQKTTLYKDPVIV